MCPGAATCCPLLGVNERPGVHHFRQKCCWRRMGHKWPGWELPAHILCFHGPPIRTRWAMGPWALGCSVCRDQPLHPQAPQLPRREKADMEAGRRQVRNSGGGPGRWETRGNWFPNISWWLHFLLSTISSPSQSAGEAGWLSPRCERAWGMSSLNMCCLALQKILKLSDCSDNICALERKWTEVRTEKTIMSLTTVYSITKNNHLINLLVCCCVFFFFGIFSSKTNAILTPNTTHT